MITKNEIEYQGETRTLQYLKEYLETGHAEYWFWHTLLYDTIKMYRRVKDNKKYGCLMADKIMIGKTEAFELNGKMANGVYPTIDCLKLIEMYEFLLGETNGVK